MDPQIYPRLKELVLATLELPPEDREAALAESCRDDRELLAAARILLAHDGGSPAHDLPVQLPGDLKPGARVGHYLLLQELGTGGMGTVYLARQQEPVERLVALKVIKLGMDTRRVVARFDQERQALAVMSHPGIARIFDAGTTAPGRPGFAMEYAHGRPMTRYCEEQDLGVRRRLELFMPVCRAVQHAHQRGIIHRDLKPSNILVTQQDGEPVPKIIDFGIAKATGPHTTEQTLTHTHHGNSWARPAT